MVLLARAIHKYNVQQRVYLQATYARYNEEKRKGDHPKRNQQTNLYVIFSHWSPERFVSCRERLSSKRVSHGSEASGTKEKALAQLGLCYSAIELPFIND